MSHVSLGRPEFVPGTPPGHPTAKFLYVNFSLSFFSLHIGGLTWQLKLLESARHVACHSSRFGQQHTLLSVKAWV